MSRSQPLTSRSLGVLGILAVLLPIQSAAETLSMSEFLELRPKWEQFAESGERFRVEGRIASASDRLVRLRHCPLPFRPVEAPLPELRRGAIAVEMVGRLGRRGTEVVFLVDEMKERPGDGDIYALKKSALDVGDPQDWYDLADWAARRGDFYDDRFLLDKAAEARRKGFALEREAAADDSAKLAELAMKAADFELAETSQELTHEALRVRWDELRGEPKSDLEPLLKEIETLLPRAAQPLPEWPMELAARYAAEPLAAYNRADADERPVLDRLFFAEVRLAAIERLADPAGANGEAIAERVAAALPERADLAERYREREIDYRLKRIESSTRSEALGLAERLEDRGRDDEAKRALAAWLSARESAARKDGPAALVPVAEDYASVLGDKESAARLLTEALEATPESKDIPSKLRQLGYVEHDGDWITKEEAATRPVDPVKAAMREGRVAVGMTPEQVRKTLGVPDRVARAASTAQVHEAWIYGERGRGGLTVHFLRYAAREADEARVVGVATLSR